MTTIFKQQRITKDPKTGKAVRKVSSCWYINHRTADGKRRHIKGYTDKAATMRLATSLDTKAAS